MTYCDHKLLLLELQHTELTSKMQEKRADLFRFNVQFEICAHEIGNNRKNICIHDQRKQNSVIFSIAIRFMTRD